MSFLTDLIKESQRSISWIRFHPGSIQKKYWVVEADSIFGSVKQTAGKEGGLDNWLNFYRKTSSF